MRIVPVSHGLDDFIGKSTLPRSGGLHLSEIYNDLYQDLEPTRYTRGTVPDPLRLEAGLSLEAFLERGLRDRLLGERPGEFTTEEGIIYSPDLIIFNSHTRLGEIKLSWLSTKEVPRKEANGFPPKFDKWFTQMKSYCRHLETPYARLLFFAVNGNYKPMSPELLAWDIEFTKRELDDNWRMMMNHARSKPYLAERLNV